MSAAGESTLILTNETSTARTQAGLDLASLDLASLVHEFGPLLFRVSYSILRSRSEAEDTVQDTFVRVVERQHTLPAIRDLRVWLVRIAWNLALDRKRRVRPDQIDPLFEQSLASATVPADRALADARRLTLLLEQLDRLSKLERQALLLSGVEELSTAEIAEILGKTESATRALLFRARQHLRERMQLLEHKAERKTQKGEPTR